MYDFRHFEGLIPDDPDRPIAHRAYDRLAAGFDRERDARVPERPRKLTEAYLELSGVHADLLRIGLGCGLPFEDGALGGVASSLAFQSVRAWDRF